MREEDFVIKNKDKAFQLGFPCAKKGNKKVLKKLALLPLEL